MSAKATFWAWEIALKASQKLVLLCLADCHNGDTNRCDPSTKYICEKTGLDKKTVPKAIKSLIEMNLIIEKKRQGTSSMYILNLTQKRVNPNMRIPQKRDTPKKYKTLPKNGSPPYPKTGNKPIKNLKENLKYYKRTDAWREFFANYPPNKKGGNDQTAWKKAKSLSLTEEDFEAMRWDVLQRKDQCPQWYSTYALGITRYLEQHFWKTPITQEKNNANSDRTNSPTRRLSPIEQVQQARERAQSGRTLGDMD